MTNYIEMFMPKEGEKYYLVVPRRDVTYTYYLSRCAEDCNSILTGNCYRTREEAEANIDKHIQAWRDAGIDIPCNQ